MVLVFRPELMELIVYSPTSSLEEFDHNRVTRSVVYKIPQIIDMEVVRLVAENIQVQRPLVLHNYKESARCSFRRVLRN